MSVSEQKLAQAAAWHEAGRLSDAEAIYLEFLRHQPGDVRVLAMLGLLRQQQGQVDEAVRLLRQAYGLAPERLDLALHLAAVEVASGSIARAKPLYQKILASDPTSRDALAGLTHVLGELGDYESALDQCERLIQHYPDLLPAREAQARLHLGAGHWDAAEATARNLLGDHPGCVDPQLVLAEIAMLRGNNERASELIERLLADQPELASAWTVKARIHQARGELSAALDAVNRSLAIEAGQEQATALQISLYQALAQLKEARQLAEQAVASSPGSAALHYALARVLQDLGEMQDSEAAFRKSLSLGSTAEPEILECLVRFQRYQPDSDDENHVRSLLQAKSLDGQGQSRLHFALGKILDDCGDYDRAYAHYQQANQKQRELRPYDSERIRTYARHILKVFDRPLVERLSAWGHPSEQPVFIVGLPRSGTSLVEQIIASHPEVFGAGELRAVPELLLRSKQLTGTPYPQGATQLGPEHMASLGTQYLGSLTSGCDQQYPRVSDKRPGNTFHLGLLLSLYPNAVAIFCDRDLRDNALSLFFQNFSEGNAFANELGDIASYHGVQSELMAHWQGLFSDRIMTVHYESLVDDLETNARSLIEHLSLTWSDQCLTFHQAQRAVQTASAHQVRQPIYRGSLQRWRNYEKYLEPVFGPPTQSSH